LTHFHNLHAGETALLVGNGPNLHLTPPQWFGYPSFGMNTIHLYEGWIPDYYITVDKRVFREFGREIENKFRNIPKFIPKPNLNEWQGENFIRFLHRPDAGIAPPTRDFLSNGFSFSNVMSVALQLAWHMGFSTCLLIGVEHKPFKAQNHFWGVDHGMTATPPVDDWFGAYSEIVSAMQKAGITVLNISENTCLSDEIIPRGDWRDWRNT